MSTRSRTPRGKFASGKDCAEAVDSLELYAKIPQTQPKRKSRLKSQDSFAKSILRMVLSGKKEETQPNKTEALMSDCRTIYKHARFCCAIIKLLDFTTHILKFLIAIYFIMNIFMQGILYSLVNTSFYCLHEKENTCYTKLMRIAFPAEVVAKSPHVKIIVKETGVSTSVTLYEATLPLAISNPIVQLAILAILVCNNFFLAYFHTLLLKVARLAKDASPELDFLAKYGELPEEL